MAKKNAAPTKSEILAQISKDTELSKKQISDVFESLNGVVKKSLKGSGLFTFPGQFRVGQAEPGHRAVRSRDQQQFRPPVPAGVRRLVAVAGPPEQIRALRGGLRLPASEWGGVHQPQRLRAARCPRGEPP